MKRIISILIVILCISVNAQEKELPPEGGTPKGFSIPKKGVITLDNGLKIVTIPYGEIPKATITISIKTGNIHEKEEEVWLADFMADLLEEGSTTLNAKQIADKMASMGGNLNIGVRSERMSLNASILGEFAPDAIAVMADVLMHPGWPASEVDRIKSNMKRDLSVSMARPTAQASKDFYAAIYPDHPYGRVYPTNAMIEGYSIEKVKAFYEANIGAKRTTVYIAGKFDEQQVTTAIKKAFESWKEGPAVMYPVAEAVTAHQVKIIDRPGAPQSTLYYGLPVVDPSHPDYTALDITNTILGGAFGSRITSNIREDKGYTYSPGSSIDNGYKSAVWYERADVTTQHTGASLKEINKEIRLLQDEAPSEDELTAIKNYEAGTFVLRNSTPGGIIGQLIFQDMHELDDSYLAKRVENIHAVTPKQVQEMMKKYIKPEQMTLVIVGDKQKIEKQVEETIRVKQPLKD
ncbi:insulinase family protein [Aquimarina sp. TRL1]|uniref:M16 family metallopeptidase n=1 Tax=Aquimarina sp. (strain TRL1) TaxID=2736252 RepID=UPI0015898AC5|nr:pitrilysin family protein [Aquimarina sp. TRL1]QKX06689.1 insulinase family protein [Aquimarina sp. TRL1]